MFVFPKIWRTLFSCNNASFEIRPFALLPTKYLVHFWQNRFNQISSQLITGTNIPSYYDET